MSDSKPAHLQVKNGNVVQFLKDYWFIVTTIIGLAVGWANFSSELKAEQKINSIQQSQIELTGASLNALDKRYIEDITYIKTTLQELRKK